MNAEKQNLSLQILLENLDALRKAKSVLVYSIQACQPQTTFTDRELESYEALTARFARAIDILTQKVFTSIFLILAENPVSFIDKCQLAEKIGMIKNASNLIKMRGLRNEIIHEYRAKDYSGLFVTIRQYAPLLCETIDEVLEYSAKLNA